jgi:hypothetical protein
VIECVSECVSEKVNQTPMSNSKVVPRRCHTVVLLFKGNNMGNRGHCKAEEAVLCLAVKFTRMSVNLVK